MIGASSYSIVVVQKVFAGSKKVIVGSTKVIVRSTKVIVGSTKVIVGSTKVIVLVINLHGMSSFTMVPLRSAVTRSDKVLAEPAFSDDVSRLR